MTRVALVTGGTRGIGHAISIALKYKGCRVAANYGGNDTAARQFQAETGVAVFDSNVPVVQLSDVVVLAVKPQSMRLVLENVRPFITQDHLTVSIAAGITIASIVQGLGSQARVVRVMPNTPALIGEGASAYALGVDDWLGPMIRNQGAMLVRGFTAADIMRQYMAKGDSPTWGRDASSHFGDFEKRNVCAPISMLG